MGDAEKAVCGGYSISWKAQNRKTFDTKRMAEDHPEWNLTPYQKTSTSRTFRISGPKE